MLDLLSIHCVEEANILFVITSQAAASVCRRFCQTSGPDWWSASSPWLIPSISSVMTTWSVSANTLNSCSLLGTCRANYVYKCVSWLYILWNQHDCIELFPYFFCWKVTRAFVAARALSQGLSTGRDIVNKATKVSDVLLLNPKHSYLHILVSYISRLCVLWSCCFSWQPIRSVSVGWCVSGTAPCVEECPPCSPATLSASMWWRAAWPIRLTWTTNGTISLVGLNWKTSWSAANV